VKIIGLDSSNGFAQMGMFWMRIIFYPIYVIKDEEMAI
jgi:hypothetical protein